MENEASGLNIVPPSPACASSFNKLRKEWWKGIHDTSFNDYITSNQAKMADATGRPPSNAWTGKNFVWLGSREECLNIPSAQYCLLPMKIENLKTVGKIGVCLPKACSSMDAVGYTQATVYLYMKVLYYQAGFFFPGDQLSFDESASQVICASE